MNIGIPKETRRGERRVACTPPESIALRELGHEVLVERGAGIGAGIADADYEKAGAGMRADADSLWRQADILCKIHPPSPLEAARLSAGKTLICFFWPAQNAELLAQLAAQGVSVLAMDAVPRISRAQKLDALSSMAHVAGYCAVLEAARQYGRFFTGQITAAGKIPPARVLVIGAGVAGLSAIGTAVSLGAVVRAFDTRAEVREQIQSMHAEFLELDFGEEGGGRGGYARVMSAEYLRAEMALFAAQARVSDIIISTALVPGKAAPKLISEAMVASMPGGGVVVDLAAEQGGNCECTEPGKMVTRHGIHIIGYTDFPSRMAAQSSQLYAANIRHLIAELTPARDGVLAPDMDDRVIRATMVTHRGMVTWPPPAPATKPAPSAKPARA
ncbi:MAG: Re/Si-specific NAD(P)(+) transhydrogenase subunit alpha, partial [Gammaproteobacteria bacterium]